MNKLSILSVTFLAILLHGCYSFQGPERLITADAKPATFQHSDVSMFVDDFEKARIFRNANRSNTNPEVPPMLRSGFMYNYSFCQNYFNVMAENQRRSKIARGGIVPITTLITGLIGLQDFSKNSGSKEDLVQLLAIGSAATTAALDIYDENFLFGTDNINSVETMTLNALAKHKSKVFEQSDVGFENAMTHLIDNQSICSPQAILTLARSSIKNARLEATNQSSQKPPRAGVASSDATEGRVTVQVNGNDQ